MNQQNYKIIKNEINNKPQTYFDLIEKVGSKGKYQRSMFFIFALVCFVNGITFINTPFLFYQQKFQCREQGLLINTCDKAVCELNQGQRSRYLIYKEDSIYSVVQQFGPFYCQDQIYVAISQSSVYFGSFCGFLIFSSISDNLGRRTAILLTLQIATLGSIIVSCSFNIIMLSIGLFLSGGGIYPAFSIIMLFFSQVVEDKSRQKYSILVQSAYTLGTILVALAYYLIQHWRIISIITTSVPSIIALIFITLYIQQTPRFLLNKDAKAALKSLNRIGKINLKIIEIISEEDLNNVKLIQNCQTLKENSNKKFVPLDLLRFSSLRPTAICISILNFLIFSMYYGPALIIDQIGFNIYVTSFVLQFSQLMIYIPSCYFVNTLKRKTLGLATFSISVISSFALMLIEKPQQCDVCFQSVIQLIVVFVFRSIISFYFILLFLYTVQLFPSIMAGIGSGVALSFGILGSTLCPIILGFLSRYDINLMILFLLYGIIGICIVTLLKETQGEIIQIDIQQLTEIKHAAKIEIIQQKQRASSISDGCQT